MVACAIWGSYPRDKRFIVEKTDIRSVVVNFTTTAVVNSINLTLDSIIDSVYNECSKDGWAVEKKIKAIGIKECSYIQAKKFTKYLNKVPLPNVVPCFDGYIGFSWNMDDISISIVFREDNQFTYSIVKNVSNHYGIITQTDAEQKHFAEIIYEELNGVISK